MKKIFTVFITSFMILASLSIFTAQEVQAISSSNFTDYNPQKWWAKEIEWGLKEKVINGYTDNTIKADNNVKEVEFITMVLRRMATADVNAAENAGIYNSWWGAPYYSVAMNYNLPTKSTKVDSTTEANAAITRGRTARIVAKVATGELMTEKEAITWLYSENLSNGKVPGQKTYESYKPNDTLTRAEAVAFIKRLYEDGYTHIVMEPGSGEVPEVISID